MKLVSFASGLTEKELESKYRKLCQRDPENTFGFEEISPDDADEFLEGCFVQDDDNQEDPAFKLLGSLQRESVLVDPEEDASVVDRSACDDPEIDQMADADEMKELLREPEEEDETDKKTEFMPGNLLEAMTSGGCKWNSLFRYAVKLRSAPGGCDCRWISNARHVRRASSKLNWHQYLVEIFEAHHFVDFPRCRVFVDKTEIHKKDQKRTCLSICTDPKHYQTFPNHLCPFKYYTVF